MDITDDEKLLSKANDLCTEITSATDMEHPSRGALNDYLKLVDDHIAEILALESSPEIIDDLTKKVFSKEDVLRNLEAIKTKIMNEIENDAFKPIGGRRRKTSRKPSRKSRKSIRKTYRRSRRSRMANRK